MASNCVLNRIALSEADEISDWSIQEQETFSRIVSRLFNPVAGDRKLFLALVGICHLLCCAKNPILTPQALPQFVQTLLVMSTLVKCDDREKMAIFTGLECLIKRGGLTSFTTDQTHMLAAIILSIKQRPMDEGYLPLLTLHMDIPGLVDALLKDGDLPPHKRLEVSAYWSQEGMRLSAEARAAQACLIKEIARSIAPSLYCPYGNRIRT